MNWARHQCLVYIVSMNLCVSKVSFSNKVTNLRLQNNDMVLEKDANNRVWIVLPLREVPCSLSYLRFILVCSQLGRCSEFVCFSLVSPVWGVLLFTCEGIIHSLPLLVFLGLFPDPFTGKPSPDSHSGPRTRTAPFFWLLLFILGSVFHLWCFSAPLFILTMRLPIYFLWHKFWDFWKPTPKS